MNDKITVIHHSADFDGLFCREIAKKFLPDAELIGWDYGQPLIPMPEGIVYILDLSPNCIAPETGAVNVPYWDRVIWIDHHKSAIEKWPASIPGYRIDGVAACRLAWQWFDSHKRLYHPTAGAFSVPLPSKSLFVDRQVSEPLAVRLAGEYDIWDKRDPRAEVFQFGLRSVDSGADFYEALLQTDGVGEKAVCELLENGRLLQRYQQRNDAGMMHRSFIVEWEGLKFLALTTARCNSLTFAAKDVAETGHDALMGYYWNGAAWNFSLYHAKHRTDLDLSKIAVKYGGGHRGACGFRTAYLPFVQENESSTWP